MDRFSSIEIKMKRTWIIILALVLLSLFPIFNLYADAQFTEENAIKDATQYLKVSPTFSYDGISDSIHVINVDTSRMSNTWSVTLGFTCGNLGYGDRTGEIVATVVTNHTMVVVVSSGKVTSAITDDAFDELTETMLNTGSDQIQETEQLALDWLKNAPTFSFDGVEDSVYVIDSYVAESYPEQYYITIGFNCTHAGYGDRTGDMLAQVITHHEAVVIVSSCEIRSAVIDGTWDELNQTEKNPPNIITSEEAVDIAIQYLQTNYPQANTLTMTDDWSIANLTPEGLVGYTTIQYSGDGWTITVGYPVVWKPVYSIDVENTNEFSWSGSVDQSGAVTESN